MDQPWQIDLLGGLRATGGDRAITRFRTHRTGVLLAYLAFYLERPHPREQLLEMLWPESERAAGRLRLRVELNSLRKQLEPPGVPAGAVLVADHTAVQLNARAVRTDTAVFEATLKEARGTGERSRRMELLHRAAALYRGELLPGAYEEWVLLERQRLADLYLASLRELSGLLHAAGDPEAAIEVAHRAIASDPLCEAAHYDLIQFYAAVHRPADALAQYRELEQMLRDELGMEPDEEIRRFVAGLAGPGSPAPAGAPGCNRRPAAPSPPPPPPAPAPEAAPAGPAPPRLPLTLTRFFGREAELAHLQELLGSPGPISLERGAAAGAIQNPNAQRAPEIQNRLVTLTGPPGCGKTRLAIEVARRLSRRFSNAVWFVPLADLTEASGIPAALAEALRLPRSPDLDPLEQAAVILGREPSLLVLDNLEHLIEDGRELVRQLVLRSPALTCLVTSRQPLELDGEQEIPVLPLPVPEGVGGRGWGVGTDKGGSAGPYTLPPTPGTLSRCPSVQLFVDRAQAVRPDFQVTARNAAAVATVCALLEGIPLAIELAAAWVRALTPDQIAGQLHCESPLLVSRCKDRTPRHQSLQAAIDWSYRLLDPALQRFFAQLTIFQGDWEIEAARFVCEQPEALSLIAALRDRSLVVAEERGERMRYRMLESLREYAQQRLSQGEWSELARRHGHYYRSLAEQAAPHLRGPRQREWTDRLREEEPNLLAALERSEGSEEGLRLASALSDFWVWRGNPRAGWLSLERLLAAAPHVPPELRAKAAFGAAALAASEAAPAEQLLEQGLSHFRLLSSPDARAAAVQPLALPHLIRIEINQAFLEALALAGEDRRSRAFLLAHDAKEARNRGDYAAALALAGESLALYRELGDPRGIGILLWLRGSIALFYEAGEAVRRYWEESLRVYQELDDPSGTCMVTAALGYLAFRQADYERAARRAQEALALGRRMGQRGHIAGALWDLGKVYACRGRYDEAAALLEESLALRRAHGYPQEVAESLTWLGLVAGARADYTGARAFLQEALDWRRRTTDQHGLADALCGLGLVALAGGQYAEAESLLGESLALGRRMRSDWMAGRCLRGLGLLACRQGNLALAEERLRESLALLSRTADRKSQAEGLEALAELRARQEQAEEAVRLHAVAVALREAIEAPLPPCDRPRQARELASLRAALAPERFAAVWEAARSRDPEELLALAEGDEPLLLAIDRQAR